MVRVSDVETQTDGSVRIVVDETRQKTISGNLDDQRIRSLLLEAVRDPSNPGLRADSVALLSRRAQSAEIRERAGVSGGPRPERRGAGEGDGGPEGVRGRSGGAQRAVAGAV